MNKVEVALAVMGTVLQALLLWRVIKLRAYREFPVFCAYIGFSVMSAVIATATSGHKQVYFKIYWISEVGYTVLTFLALNESFRSVFRNFYSFAWFKVSFPTIGLLILLIAALRAIFFRPPGHSPQAVAIISLEIAVGFLQFVLFCLFILLVRFFHMQWQQRAFGIILGFGIGAACSLVSFLLRSEFGTNIDKVFRITTPLSYIIGVAVWLATFLRAEKSQLANDWDSSLTPEQMISELRRHTKAVKGMLGR